MKCNRPTNLWVQKFAIISGCQMCGGDMPESDSGKLPVYTLLTAAKCKQKRGSIEQSSFGKVIQSRKGSRFVAGTFTAICSNQENLQHC